MTVALAPCSERWCTVHVDGPFLAPMNNDLPGSILDLLRTGERGIVLDLSNVSLIDAGGVGELVRAYNIACGMDVSLRIVHTTRWVRETLARVGLFDLLNADAM